MDKRVDPDAADNAGNTAGHHAVMAGHAHSFNCFLQHDGSIYVINHRGDDVMATAKKSGHPILMEKASK